MAAGQRVDSNRTRLASEGPSQKLIQVRKEEAQARVAAVDRQEIQSTFGAAVAAGRVSGEARVCLLSVIVWSDSLVGHMPIWPSMGFRSACFLCGRDQEIVTRHVP